MAADTTAKTNPLAGRGQISLVFQGGGALGAYQAGVYEALHEAGIEPDWIIGTSIGAINAGIIAGNLPENRLDRLKAFWDRVRHPASVTSMSALPFLGGTFAAMNAVTSGIPGFFSPNAMAFLGPKVPLGPDNAGYYSTAPLRRTLEDLIDPALLGAQSPRVTFGAANVSTGEMRYFDSSKEAVDIRHVMASGALPPAFPAVRIDGTLYWDGGILSNTPVEAVFDDKQRQSGIVFVVHLWRRQGEEPRSIWDVANREKDLQYACRAVTHIKRQRQIHRLRHIISALADKLPPELRDTDEVRSLAGFGCKTQMHVVRLLSPRLQNEDHTKDIDFSPSGIDARWRAGLADTRAVLEARPWEAPCDPDEGLILHDTARREAQLGQEE
jgi:NTE family protein